MWLQMAKFSTAGKEPTKPQRVEAEQCATEKPMGHNRNQRGDQKIPRGKQKRKRNDPEPMTVKVAQSCLTFCDPKDYTVHGILQARILGWVAFPFSRESSQPRDRTQVSCAAGRFFTS